LDIEEETGDLVAYMGAVIANLVNHPDRGAPSTDDNREQLTKAFYIWLDEGCPEGRADAHWQMATEQAAAEGGRADLAAQPGTNPTTPRAAQPDGFQLVQRLRKRPQRPGYCRTAYNRDELTPSSGMP
jgi:hypothetical protein